MKEYIKREVLSKIMNDIAGDETCPMNIAADIYYAVDCIPAACLLYTSDAADD